MFKATDNGDFLQFYKWLFRALKDFRILRNGQRSIGMEGWRSGESSRLKPMWPGFDSRLGVIHGMSLFVFCTARFFSGYSGFPLSSKTNI